MSDDYTLKDLELFNRAVRVNTLVLSFVLGIVCGGALWIGTYVLLIQGGTSVGAHLSLLSLLLPGYSVSPAGAWIGFIWGFVTGALAGAFIYWRYARGMRRNIVRRVLKPASEGLLIRSTLLLSSRDVGLPLGVLFSAQIFFSTNWLILRGTATSNPHAHLLNNYLPGYDVTFFGSLIGSVEVFALIYAASALGCATYNAVARRRFPWNRT